MSMFGVLSEDFPVWVWLCVYVLCLANSLLAPSMCAFARLRSARLWCVSQFITAALVLFVAADLVRCALLITFSADVLRAALMPLLATTAGALIFSAHHHVASRALGGSWNRWLKFAAQSAVCCLLTAIISVRLFQVADVTSDWHQPPTPRAASPQLVASDAYAVTDVGNRLPLFRYDTQSVPGTDPGVPPTLNGRVILYNDAYDSPANCHGWVFTGGEYLVPSVSVDDILRDNAYEQVPVPRPNDLIIYRSSDGRPVHTGLVKATGKDGFVLIESKWGPLSIYLHLPDDQVYSPIYDYYRSTRGDHRLQVMHKNAPPANDEFELAQRTRDAEQRRELFGASATTAAFDFGLTIPWRNTRAVD